MNKLHFSICNSHSSYRLLLSYLWYDAEFPSVVDGNSLWRIVSKMTSLNDWSSLQLKQHSNFLRERLVSITGESPHTRHPSWLFRDRAGFPIYVLLFSLLPSVHSFLFSQSFAFLFLHLVMLVVPCIFCSSPFPDISHLISRFVDSKDSGVGFFSKSLSSLNP